MVVAKHLALAFGVFESTYSMIPHSKPWITNEDKNSLMEVLNSGLIAKGELVKEFEKSVGRYLGLGPGVATSSGTAALVLALEVPGVAKNAEVILPTYVCRSVLNAVLTIGAVPRICDVGPEWLMTAKEIEPLVSKKTAAIVAVHIFGLPVNIDALRLFGVPIIEDACQAFGLKINGRFAGGLGHMGLFSFHATKCFTTAEGGMLVSHDSSVMEKAKEIRDSCRRSVAPLSDLQAALGLSQLARYDTFLGRRRKLKSNYFEALNRIGGVETPNNSIEFLFRFPLRVHAPPEVLQARFAESGIHVRKGVDSLLHRELGLPDKSYPNGVRAIGETISIPFYPALSDEESEIIINELIEIFD